MTRPTVVLLHFLGGSTREWREAIALAGAAIDPMPLDLPGFGEAAAVPGHDVAAMADRVAQAVRSRAPERWVLVGHSMGAKVAALLARRAEDGEPGLAGLGRIVMLAGSPPGPEPMEDSKREAMRGWFAGDAASSAAEASTYIDQNVGATLPDELKRRAVEDVLRADRAAWLAWLDRGSKEDWADRIGVLRTPATIVAGTRDGALGPAAQRERMLPHFAQPRLVELEGAGHLLPMERPEAIARLLTGDMG